MKTSDWRRDESDIIIIYPGKLKHIFGAVLRDVCCFDNAFNNLVEFIFNCNWLVNKEINLGSPLIEVILRIIQP